MTPSAGDPYAAGMETQTPYNYPAFSFALEAQEYERWLQAGPRTGQRAPDFDLTDVDGETVRLRDLHGRPVVIEFGSYTCPVFSDRVPAMERMARENPDAAFLVIAVREAHPGELTPQHATALEKRAAARRLAMEEGLQRRVLVDDSHGTVNRAYGGAWDAVYVLDAEGRIAFRRAWNDPDEVAAALRALSSASSPPAGETVEMAQLPSSQPMGLRLLERGGQRALLDFYSSAPPPVRRRLEDSPSAAVRAALRAELKDDA